MQLVEQGGELWVFPEAGVKLDGQKVAAVVKGMKLFMKPTFSRIQTSTSRLKVYKRIILNSRTLLRKMRDRSKR